MAILTTTVERTFTRTKKERSCTASASTILANLQALPGANNSTTLADGRVISPITFSNVNIVSAPQFQPLEFTQWQESPGSPAPQQTTPQCLDQYGAQQHAGAPWHRQSSVVTDGTPGSWTAGAGGTTSVSYTYDATWTCTPPLPTGPAGGVYNAVGVQSSQNVPIDERETTQTKVEVFAAYAGGIICY